MPHTKLAKTNYKLERVGNKKNFIKSQNKTWKNKRW